MDDETLSQAIWLADNLSSFAIHAAACLAVIALGLFVTRSPRFATLALIAAAPFAYLIAEATLTGASVGACASADSRLRVASVNLLIDNKNRDAVGAFLDSEKPDVVAFLEVGNFWHRTLPALTADYPHVAANPRGATRIYSRLPFVAPPRTHAVPGVSRTIAVDVESGGTRVTVVAGHLLKPTTANMRAARRAQFDAVGAFAAAEPRPTVVVGDFNAGPTSLDFTAMLAASPLRAPALQMPPVATWPSRFGPFGMQIDHILATEPIVFERVSGGQRVGSNHLPVVADLALGGCS